MNKKKLVTILNVFVWAIISVKAQTDSLVAPQIEIAVRTITTLNYYKNNGAAALEIPILNESQQVLSDFSDSYVMLGITQPLYRGWQGQMAVGFTFPDVNGGLGQIFFNQVMLNVTNKRNNIRLGRSRSQTTINEFTTFRDDDAIQYNYALNPFSKGINTEDNQYANVLEYTRIFQHRLFVSLHAENYIDFHAPTDLRLNGIGGSLIYHVPDNEDGELNILENAGVSWDSYINTPVTDSISNSQIKTLNNIIGSATLNVKRDPENFIDFRIQAIHNFGFNEVKDITDYDSYTRTKALPFFVCFVT